MDDAKALSRRMRAVERTPAAHPLRARRINNLGAAWRERIAADGDIDELDQAISYFRAAAAAARWPRPSTSSPSCCPIVTTLLAR